MLGLLEQQPGRCCEDQVCHCVLVDIETRWTLDESLVEAGVVSVGLCYQEAFRRLSHGARIRPRT